MPTHLEALRSRLAISQLCQVFEATLHSCIEEGFPRHQLHYMPSPIIIEEAGRKVILPEPQVACLYGLTRHSPLKIPAEDEAAFARRPPFESLLLTMPVSIGPLVLPQRTRVLREAEGLMLDLMEQKERSILVTVSHRRLVHGRLLVRHQPAALCSREGKVIWLHPAAQRFGLLQAPFPRSQRQRNIDTPEQYAREQAELSHLDEEGLPAWYFEARQAIIPAGEEDPIAEALLGIQVRSLIEVNNEKEAKQRLLAASQTFLSEFEALFGMGGLLPQPGLLDLA